MRLAALCTILVFLTTVSCKRKDGKRKSENEKYKVLPNICSDENPNSLLMCNCDQSGFNAATTAECYVLPTIEDYTFPAHQFSSQTNLVELKLSVRNRGVLQEVPTAIFQLTRKLESFKIKYGSIYEIRPQAFGNASYLREIDLSQSGISVLHPNACSYHISLEKVTLDDNNIYELQPMVFHHVPNLERLSLARNNLTIVHDNAFRFLNKLFELDLQGNSISIITRETFNGLFHLRRLDLTSNKLNMIGQLTFAEMPDLQELTLDANKLTYIADRAFAGLPLLSRLRMSDNQLKTISDQLFVDNPKIQFLDLRDNEMVELKLNTLKPIWDNFKNHSAHLYLSGNQFPCDCYLSWIYQLKNETTNKVIQEKLDELTCILGEDMLDDAIISSEQNDQYVDDNAVYDDDVEYEPLPDELGPPRKKVLEIPQEDLPCPEQFHATTEEAHGGAELPSRSASASSSSVLVVNVSLVVFGVLKTAFKMFLT